MAEPRKLTLHIDITGGNSVLSDLGQINLVTFGGTAESDFFNGTILAGGVDTQMFPADKSKQATLSARYIIEGKDDEGNSCKLFIENNGIFWPDKVTTVPKIYTDSKKLKWLESTEFEGLLTGTEDPSKVLIILSEKTR